MRQWRFVVLAAGVWGATAAPAVGQTLTEEQALARMRAEHPHIEALLLGVRELEAGARERRLLANPTVSYTREDAGPATDDFLLVSQELPVRGRIGLLGEAAGHAVTAAEARADASALAFETRLRLAFTALLLAQERTSALDTALSELRRLVDVLRAREREGEGSRFDRLRAEREVADIETDLEVAAIERQSAQARLAAFFASGTDAAGLTAAGTLLDDPVRTDAAGLTAAGTLLDDPVRVDPGTLVERALARRADYRALALSEVQWSTERRAAERLRYPGAALSAGLKRTGAAAASESGYAVTATMVVPLFNRGQAQVARATAARARISAERRALRGRIENEVRAAHVAATRYRGLADRYRAASVEPAAELVAIASAAYEEGEYGILELLDAYRVTLAAETRLLELSAEARRAAIELDMVVGKGPAP